jgi:hypothetical protein
MTDEIKVPTGTVFTLIVPLDREGKEKATFHMKDMTEEVYMGAKTLIDKGKDFDAVRMIIRALWLGGDQPDRLKDNFVAVQSASRKIIEFLEPLEGELKKN